MRDGSEQGLARIQKLTSRTKEAVASAALHVVAQRPQHFKTITFDNGTEFHGYKALEDRFSVRCYFATPYHSWERGSVENLNGLIRQYLPKGVCMRTVTQGHCNFIASRLNTRPRKRYGFKSPSLLYPQTVHPLHFDVELRFRSARQGSKGKFEPVARQPHLC